MALSNTKPSAPLQHDVPIVLENGRPTPQFILLWNMTRSAQTNLLEGVEWIEVIGKPATFPPSTHAHGWVEITGKPATFPPSAHNHAATEITAGAYPAGVFTYVGSLAISGAAAELVLNGSKVVGVRNTGWAAMTGTASKAAIDTATATLVQALERLKAHDDALIAHGLIGA